MRKGKKKPKRHASPVEAATSLNRMSTAPAASLTRLEATNKALRAGNPAPDNALAAAMAPIPDAVAAFRSVPRSEFGDVAPEDLRGFVVQDAGYFPTSLAPTAPQPGEVRMEIDVPAGTRAAGSPDTHELIIDAGTEMSVDDVRTNPDGSTVMTLTALPEGNDSGAGPADGPEGTDAASEAADGDSDSTTDARVSNLIDEAFASRDLGPLRDGLSNAFGGEYAGMRVQVAGVSPWQGGATGEQRGATVSLTIHDADGNEVGHSERIVFLDENGDLAVRHELLELDPEVRGNGFASEFNRNMEAWYREQGVTRIVLEANIDVGGYAWASHGYDFASEDDANHLAERLANQVSESRGEADRLRKAGDTAAADGLDSQIAAAESVLERVRSAKFGSADYPTPYDMSQAGRTPGAKTWLGKNAALGSDWEGVKWL